MRHGDRDGEDGVDVDACDELDDDAPRCRPGRSVNLTCVAKLSPPSAGFALASVSKPTRRFAGAG